MGLTKEQLVHVLVMQGLTSGDYCVYVEAEDNRPLLSRSDLASVFLSATSSCSNGKKNGLIAFKSGESYRARTLAETCRGEPRFQVVEGPYVVALK